jgi:hypothetical protein
MAPNAISTPASPLFEKEGCMLLLALLAYGVNPLRAHGASFRARFATDDDPVDTTEIQRTNILK